MSTLVVCGGLPLRGNVRLLGDKSISHRALILASLANLPTVISDLSPCGDVARTWSCLSVLGVRLERQTARSAVVHGRGPRALGGPHAMLYCGDSGTAMRLLAGALAGQARHLTLSGTAALRRRPMRRIVEPLRRMGADIEAGGDDGRPPLVGRGARLHGAELTLAHASAQVGSAVLLAGLSADGPTTVHYPAPVRDHMERMLAAWNNSHA